MDEPEIRVLKITRLPGNKSLWGFADIQLDDWIIREWRIIKENSKRPRVASPQTSWKNQDGQIQYKTIVTLPDELKGQIDFAILKRFNEEMERENGNKKE
jgi:hypothetical protein